MLGGKLASELMSMNMKEIEFPTASYEQWQEEAVKALKGKSFESLFTKTFEGITLEPLYTQEKLIEKLGDQLEKQVSTIRTLTANDGLEIAQQVIGYSKEEFIANLEDSLARGNEVITVDSRLPFELDEQLIAVLGDYFTEYSFKLTITNANDPILALFEKIEDSKRADVEGYIISEEAIDLAAFPKVRTFAANTVKFHNDGANAVQELAIALAQAAKFAEQSDSYEAFARKYFVNFAVDTQFFTEVAKLRAFKVLWKAFSSAYNAEALAVPIVAETSVRSFSKVDVYVNLLRAGNEALSAAIGGANVMTVHPHDALTKPTAQSIRIARNTLLVTKEESLVLNVQDPAGGSYFVESLTADLVTAAWELFLKIQVAGGLDAYLPTLTAEIEAIYNERIKQVETRKLSLIGTNIYANPADELPTEENVQFADVKRLAIPFEKLRATFIADAPKVGVLTFGELKNFKPRADYVTGLFAVAGIVPDQSGELKTVEEAQKWLQQCDYQYVVVAGADEDTKAVVPALLEVKGNIVLEAAGKFKDEEAEWTAAGLNGFIFAGQNIIEKLNSVTASVKEVL